MKLEDKKILHLAVDAKSLNQIKSGEKKSELLEYNKQWKERLMYPCGTHKKYDFVLIKDETQEGNTKILVGFKGIKIVKEKKNWFKTEKFFEVELGKIIEE